MNWPRVLLVEDDEIIAETYLLKLQMEGLNAAGAENGREALAQLSGFAPDVIILDMLMPKMNGLEFIHELHHRSMQNSSHILLFTNLSRSADIDAALKLGAKMHLHKSQFTPLELADFIKDYWQKQTVQLS